MASELAERIAEAAVEYWLEDTIAADSPVRITELHNLTAIVEGVLAEHGDVSIRANLRYRNEIARLRALCNDAVAQVERMCSVIGCICDDTTQCGCGFFETTKTVVEWRKALEGGDDGT